MALVCDIESTPADAAEEHPQDAEAEDRFEQNEGDAERMESCSNEAEDPDLEDGEIEDDEEEGAPPSEPAPAKEPEIVVGATLKFQPPPEILSKEKIEKDKAKHERRRHEEGGGGKKKHMTEAEKSILHLRKRERMQREKWEKLRKEQQFNENPDDFAINIEKAIASVLKKDRHDDEDKEEEPKRPRKRKNRDKDRLNKANKLRKIESPKSEDFDETEFLNVRGGSPNNNRLDERKDISRSMSPRSDDSYESEYSSESDRNVKEERRNNKREFNKKGKQRQRDRKQKKGRDRERRAEQLKDAQGVCVFFLQGKCQKNDCPYSHEAVPPMKLELCKFYLMECCAKGEKCSYMHSDFPCKFYHTGLACLQGENCKFAHGKPLSEGLKQILFKHIETAPREILGGFPRMSREEALNMINTTQQSLQVKYSTVDNKNQNDFDLNINVPMPVELQQDFGHNNLESSKPEKRNRNRPSRWQDPDPMPQIKPFIYGQDQDMRISSNGDVDMRTLPPINQIQNPNLEPIDPNTNFTQDIDIRNPNMLQFDTRDVDIRQSRMLSTGDVDIRQIPPVFEPPPGIIQQQQLLQLQQQSSLDRPDDEEENKLLIDTADNQQKSDDLSGFPLNLPKTQRDLFLRIQAQQKTNQPEELEQGFEVDDNINWYSDDDDDDENRLTIKVDNEEDVGNKARDDNEDAFKPNIMSPPQIKPMDMVEKLGDLSKIDISAEVTKLLTSITQTASSSPKEPPAAPKPAVRDPRQLPQNVASDPRQRSGSTEIQQAPKLSIYEQGSMNMNEPASPDEVVENDFRGRPDVDLRSLQLPFKGMLNYTPAKEIDASFNSHPPIVWRVEVVDIPRPDYTGLKLNVQDAEKTGDPRLKKIFRLNSNDKDSPASPKSSPKAAVVRIDPRLKKVEDSSKPTESVGILNYAQQLSLLQSSVFFQSLTSNQKVLLTQELTARNEQNNSHDPILNSMLTNLNLVPQTNLNSPNMNTALNILASVNKLNPALLAAANPQGPPMVLGGQNPGMMNHPGMGHQPGLLGAAPGVPNMQPDFSMGFDPRNVGGLLGNQPPPFGNFQNDNFGGNFDEYYPQDNDNNFGHSRNNRDNNRNFHNRDRRRGGRNNFNRNNRNFRNRNHNNRSNRSHSPP